VSALDAARVPALPLQGMLLPPSRQRAEFASLPPGGASFPMTILCMNGDSIPLFAREVGDDFFRGRYTIALWWWELSRLPDAWGAAFEHIDEVWVATDHIYRAAAADAPVPVYRVPLPVSLPAIVPYTREALGLPEGYLFLFMYDYHSTSARKNPLGVIEAFTRAFPEGSGASLVLKSINHENLPEHHEAIAVAAARHGDIHLIDQYVSADEKNAMLAACDCYVSLHRSEGFGLTPAEAMYLGKPVIATRYGGVLDFMNDQNSYLVAHDMSRVGDGAHPYPRDAEWAEPDVDQAAKLMRRVFEHTDEAREVGERAAADIRASNSPEVAGAAMKRRLQAIYERHLPAQDGTEGSVPGDDVAVRLATLERDVARGPLPPRPGRLQPVRRAAGRAVSKLTAPQTHHMKQLGERVGDALERLHHEHHEALAEQRASRADAMAEIRRLRSGLKDATTRLQALERRLFVPDTDPDPRFAAVDQHLAEHETVPFMAPEHAFRILMRDGAGKVLGFTQPLPDIRETEWYRVFEDAFRGTEERVRTLQAGYVDLLAEHAPVLDVGCGRGELLDLLRQHGVWALGVDVDAGMVATSRAKGHEVVHSDVNAYLESRDPRSLGAVVASEVIEHLPFPELMRFLDLSHRTLRNGGIAILETVNPHCLPALKGFWIDPTHQHPLFPEVVLTLCRIHGFGSGYAYHPTGVGDFNTDRLRAPFYAVVVEKRRRTER
jgi:glycosyltransferase involved in cell wall biosynthesis/SAM-dependent methyltransferase